MCFSLLCVYSILFGITSIYQTHGWNKNTLQLLNMLFDRNHLIMILDENLFYCVCCDIGLVGEGWIKESNLTLICHLSLVSYTIFLYIFFYSSHKNSNKSHGNLLVVPLINVIYTTTKALCMTKAKTNFTLLMAQFPA